MAIPGAFFIGLLLLPTGASAPVALSIIVIGVIALVVGFERVLGREARGTRRRGRSFLSTTSGRVAAGFALGVALIYVVFVAAVSSGGN